MLHFQFRFSSDESLSESEKGSSNEKESDPDNFSSSYESNWEESEDDNPPTEDEEPVCSNPVFTYSLSRFHIILSYSIIKGKDWDELSDEARREDMQRYGRR